MDPRVQAALTGGLVSAAGDLLGSGLSFGLGQAAAGQQWDKWKDSQTRGPLYRLIGLEEAGLNPILAAKGGLGGGGGGFTPTAVASGGGGLPLGSNATRAAKELGLMRDQSKNIRAQTKNQTSAADLNRAMERIRNIDKNVARQNLIGATANAKAMQSESLARQARAIIDQDLATWYMQNPNVYIAKDLAGEATSLINSATKFVDSFRSDVVDDFGTRETTTGEGTHGSWKREETRRGSRRSRRFGRK